MVEYYIERDNDSIVRISRWPITKEPGEERLRENDPKVLAFLAPRPEQVNNKDILEAMREMADSIPAVSRVKLNELLIRVNR